MVFFSCDREFQYRMSLMSLIWSLIYCTGCNCSDFKTSGRILPRACAATLAPAGACILGWLSFGAWRLARFLPIVFWRVRLSRLWELVGWSNKDEVVCYWCCAFKFPSVFHCFWCVKIISYSQRFYFAEQSNVEHLLLSRPVKQKLCAWVSYIGTDGRCTLPGVCCNVVMHIWQTHLIKSTKTCIKYDHTSFSLSSNFTCRLYICEIEITSSGVVIEISIAKFGCLNTVWGEVVTKGAAGIAKTNLLCKIYLNCSICVMWCLLIYLATKYLICLN